MHAQIPPEIWDLVFRYLPPSAHRKLRQVSRPWRDLVDATPELWTTVLISHTRQFAEPPGLVRWLAMSRQLALDVVIKVPRKMKPKLPPTLGILRDHLHRFRTLDIHTHTIKVADTLLAPFTVSNHSRGAPLLEGLYIAIDEGALTDRPGQQSYFERGFIPAPRLQTLVVPTARIPAPSTKFLSTITSLTITSTPDSTRPSVENILDTIAAIPCLESFNYSGTEVFSYQPTCDIDYPRVVRLPYLENVDVTVPGCGQDILQCLEAPLLKSVRLDGWREEEYAEHWLDGYLTDVSALLKRLPERSPSIRILDLDCVEKLKSETLDWLLCQNPYTRLEELRIKNSAITDTTLRKAARHGPLRRLELRDCRNITGSALKHYIISRRFSAPQDFGLWVSECPGVTDVDLAQLAQIADVES